MDLLLYASPLGGDAPRLASPPLIALLPQLQHGWSQEGLKGKRCLLGDPLISSPGLHPSGEVQAWDKQGPSCPHAVSLGTQTDLGPCPLPSFGAEGLREGPKVWQPGPVSENPGVLESRSAAPRCQGHRPAGRPGRWAAGCRALFREHYSWDRSPSSWPRRGQRAKHPAFSFPQGPS